LLQELTRWLYGTEVSRALRTTAFVIPTLDTLHLLAGGALLTVLLALVLPLWGGAADTAAALRRQTRWLWLTLAALTATGLVLLVADPRRVLVSGVFGVKMLLMLAMTAATLGLIAVLGRGAMAPAPGRRRGTGLLAALSLILFVAVTVAGKGRWIGNLFGR
jgi:hypothetical protein